jgi:hypothetical protein
MLSKDQNLEKKIKLFLKIEINTLKPSHVVNTLDLQNILSHAKNQNKEEAFYGGI